MMLTSIISLFLSTQYFVIYANPLYQTYGPRCQCQHNPWYPSDLMFEPTNIEPYSIVHKPSPPAYQTPNNQEYVNKIFSNPSIKAILDPNTKLYDVNGIEIPRINPERCPNVINNYIIIPPEVLADKQYSKQKGGSKNNSNQRKIKASHRSTNKNNKFVENNNQKRITASNLLNNSHVKSNENNVNQNSVKSKSNKKNRNERKRKIKVQSKGSNTNLDKSLSNNNAVKQKDKVVRLKIITHPTNQREEAVVQEFKRKFPGIPEEVVRSLLSYLKRKLSNGEIDIKNQTRYSLSSDTTHKQVTKRKRKSRKRKDRKGKNKKKEFTGSVNDKKDESLQESTQSLKNYEKDFEINNNEMNITKFTEYVKINSSESEFLLRDDIQKVTTEDDTIKENYTAKSISDKDFKSINLNLASHNITENSQKIVQNNNNSEYSDNVLPSKNKEVKQEVNQEESNENIEQKYKSDTDDHKLNNNYNEVNKPDTNSQYSNSKLDNNNNEDTKPDTDGHKLDYNYIVDNTRLPELGTEDEVPITVNGLFEDYYPDFRTENQFTVSNEEFPSLDSHQSMQTELSRERRKYEQNYNKNHHTKLVLNEDKVHKTDEHNEKLSDGFSESMPVSMTVQKESEEITFIAPPGLEIPDFKTKNVKELKSFYEETSKYEPIYKYSDVRDKTSVYSDAKTSKYEKAGPVWNKDKQRDLETVFARSKVVKYGQTPDNTVVIAESYPDYEW